VARAKLKASQASDPNISVSPAHGMLQPGGSATLTLRFHPVQAEHEASTGFEAVVSRAQKLPRLFDFQMMVDVAGAAAKQQLTIAGKAIVPALTASPATVQFGDVINNSYADQLVTLTNQGQLPLTFKAEKAAPYFWCEPPEASLAAGEALQLRVRYQPKALGAHSAVLPLQLFSPDGHRLKDGLLRVSGTSLFAGAKPPLIGGPDKLPEDFSRVMQLVTSETLARSTARVASLAQPQQGPPTYWEKPGTMRLLEAVGPEGTKCVARAPLGRRCRAA